MTEENNKPRNIGRINRRELSPEDGAPKTWWRTSRRNVIIGGAAGAGVLLAGGATWLVLRDDTAEIDQDSLALQQSQGWNVGSEEKTLTLVGAQQLDSRGSAAWRDYLQPSAMLAVYDTKSDVWMPFFVPTLIQSLQFDSLRNQLTLVFTPDMAEAYGRGQAIARDFLTNAQNPNETALIVDLPGKASVAFGAGVADAGRLITTFDNYPHPLGVTPSHETLAAMLYYASEIDTKQRALAANAPPVLLLDSNRLANYTDSDSQFDNRYIAKIPSAEKLKERGVKSLIYVTPDRTRTEELDDLNEEFVLYKESGLNVAMLPLSDFTIGDGTLAQGDNATNERRYHYGGHPMFLPFFFYSYPFYSPRGGYARTPSTIGSYGGRAPSPPRYIPTQRPTLFSGTRIGGRAAGVGRSKPTGFGRATVRVASSGRVVGTRAGRSGYYSPGRSGSFGRGGGYGG